MDAQKPPDGAPSEAEIREQLARILDSASFHSSGRLQDLLKHIVEETLAGRSENLLGKNIQSDVFGRADASSADGSSKVRVEVGRVRRRLHQFYDTDGHGDLVRIDVPKGAYTAAFHYVQSTAQAGEEAREKRPRRAIHRAVVVSVAAAVAVIFGVWLLSDRRTANAPDATPIVAVLPLQRIGTEFPVHDIVDGIVSDLVTDLSRVQGLFVISLASSSRLAREGVELDEAGDRLGASHLVHGTIQYDGRRFRINLRLHRVHDGRQIWAERFDYSDTDTAGAQDKIAREVSKALSVRLMPDQHRPRAGRRAGSKAQTLFSQTKDLMNPPTDPARVAVATNMLRRVIAIDPDSAIGYAGLAYALATAAWFRPPDDVEAVLAEVGETAGNALKIDPTAARAHVALCIVALIRRQFEQAERHCSKGVEVRPNDDLARAFNGLILVYTGRPVEGAEALRVAINLNPLEPRTGYLNMLGQAYFHAGLYKKSLAAFQRSMREGGPVGSHIIYYLAASYAKTGNAEAAQISLKQLARFGGGYSFEQ